MVLYISFIVCSCCITQCLSIGDLRMRFLSQYITRRSLGVLSLSIAQLNSSLLLTNSTLFMVLKMNSLNPSSSSMLTDSQGTTSIEYMPLSPVDSQVQSTNSRACGMFLSSIISSVYIRIKLETSRSLDRSMRNIGTDKSQLLLSRVFRLLNLQQMAVLSVLYSFGLSQTMNTGQFSLIDFMSGVFSRRGIGVTFIRLTQFSYSSLCSHLKQSYFGNLQ